MTNDDRCIEPDRCPRCDGPCKGGLCTYCEIELEERQDEWEPR